MAKRVELPFRTPSWMSPKHVVVATTALGGALAASPVVRPLGPWEIGGSGGPAMRVVLVLSTAGLSVLLGRIALRAQPVARAVATCVVGATVAGPVNAGLVLAVTALFTRADLAGALAGLLFGATLGAIFAAPIGLAYGLAYAVLVGPAARAAGAPSHAAPDRVLALSGAWLGLVGAALLLGPSRGVTEPVAASAAAVLGAAVAALGLGRSLARRRWLGRVEAGRIPGVAIAQRRFDEAEAQLLPWDGSGPWNGVLVAREAAGDPYRSSPSDVPLALTTLRAEP